MTKDEFLKLRFMWGSQQALEEIYETYQDDLLTVAMALLGNTQTAEDVLHDVFVRLAQSWQSFAAQWFAWKCCHRRCRD